VAEGESHHHARLLKETLHFAVPAQVEGVDLSMESTSDPVLPSRHFGGGSKYAQGAQETLWVGGWRERERAERVPVRELIEEDSKLFFG
jgi:hypothetical protein